MATVRQLSFSAGEITPALYARIDQIKYATGLRTCLNWMVMRHGGVTTRPGTGFVAEVKDSTKSVRLIPFIFNSSQTYILEFGDLYMRVHKNGAQLTETAKNVTAATQANPCVVTITSHGYSDGDEVAIAVVSGMTELNNRNFKVANKTANTFELQTMDSVNLDATGFTAYTSGGTTSKVYEIITTYVEADLPELRYIQSADIVTITHPTYPVREVARTGDTSWSITDITFGATIGTPTNLLSSSPGANFNYRVTAVSATTNEESLPSILEEATTAATTLTWDAVAGAGHYNVYRQEQGQYGFIGLAGAEASPSFLDATLAVDPIDTPPNDRQPFDAVGDYPSTCTYYQQRLIFANTDNNTELVEASKTGLRKNFMISTPLQDDDNVSFEVQGNQVNEVQHLLDIGTLVLFTSSAEYIAQGGSGGALTPTTINIVKQSTNGSGFLRPLVANDTALYVQARGSAVRDLGFNFEADTYTGNELTIFASHLIEGFTLVDWDYQTIPHSIVWAVRSDGVLLGLTYVREHGVIGWHRHTFSGGTVENVAVVPRGTEDALYVVVSRTINGRTTRYIEEMKTRLIGDIEDYIGMDSSLSLDGTNTNTSHTMTLSGGSTWAYDEDLTLTSSTAFFVAGDIGNQIWLTGSDGTIIRATITAFTSTTIVTARPNKDVPAAMQAVAIAVWGHAVDEVTGIWHLEGENVSVLVDGYVSADPNDSAIDIKTVTDGTISFADPHVVIHIGLPIVCDLEPLAIDQLQGSSLSDKKKHISKLTVHVKDTRGLLAGPDSTELTEFKLRTEDDSHDAPIPLQTGTIDQNIIGNWSDRGDFLIRQTAPLPATVLAIIPGGFIAK